MKAYLRVYNLLRERIAGGKLPPGEKLRPEPELAAEFGVSRITARHALKLLQDQGLIGRAAGRGTFVRGAPAAKLAIVNTDFVGSMRKAAPEMTRRLLRRENAAPPPEVAEALGLLPGEQCLVAERADLLGGEPVACDQAYIPLRLAGEIDDALLARLDFFNRWLADRDLAASCVSESIEAVAADRATAAKLKVSRGAPVLVARETVHGEGGAALAHFVSCYRGDRFRRTATIQIAPGALTK